MFKSMNIAGSGMRTYEKALEISSGNAANLKTTGYAKKQFILSDLKHKKQIGSNNSLDRGLGVKIANCQNSFTQGELQNTDVNTHYAIIGDGFFKIKDQQTGREFFTRAGNFIVMKDIEAEEPTYYLGTEDGMLVMSSQNQKLIWSPEDKKAKLDVGIFKVNQNEKLHEVGNCMYEYTAGDEPQINTEAKLEQFALEDSNADISEEALKIMMAKEGHSASNRVFRVASDAQDEVTALLN